MSKNTTRAARTAVRTVRLADAVVGDTVRLRDPKTGTWGNVVVGTKKGDKVIARVRAAQAERNKPEAVAARAAAKEARDAALAERSASNKHLALAMRAAELVPAGSAWTAFKAGERDVETLAAMNAADGLVFRKPVERKPEPAAPAPAKPAKAEQRKPKGKPAPRKAEAVAPAAPEAKPAKAAKPSKAERKAARKAAEAERARRAEAARKGWETRRANAAQAQAAEPTKAERKAAKAARKAAKAERTAQRTVAVDLDLFETFAAPLRTVGLTEDQIALAFAIKHA